MFKAYKSGFIKSLLFRCFSFCSEFVKLYDLDTLKNVLFKDSWLPDLGGKCIKEFLDKMQAPKTIVSAVRQIELLMPIKFG